MIPLGRYMWERIKQVGVSSIFGVPGDFNLTLLDHIYHVQGLSWVGNTNELNAAYAADGYARVKNGAGCVVTTHGVGELSALNAIAGAMAEHVKVIHVVGQTSRAMQAGRVMIHHTPLVNFPTIKSLVAPVRTFVLRRPSCKRPPNRPARSIACFESASCIPDRCISSCQLIWWISWSTRHPWTARWI
jgi:TPP-dependent 2-oxoacid decarboxylase